MPVLKNQRHERFAQSLADGKSADEAYQDAGFEENRGNASRLKSKESILKRVSELLERAAKRVELTAADILTELAEARNLARQNGQANAMVAASMGRAKVAGLIIDKQERGKPGDFDRMTDDELNRYIQTEARAVGGGFTGTQQETDEGEAVTESRRLN